MILVDKAGDFRFHFRDDGGDALAGSLADFRFGFFGKVKVFEINPRFSGTTSIRAIVGYNEPDILLRRHLLNDRSIEPDFEYSEALILRNLVEVVGDKYAQ